MPDITRYNTMAFDILEHFKAFILNPNSGKKWLKVTLKDIE
ncbi:MAG TPA: hypothetical protein P5513_04110 [Candidatus Diapherotrites archaeon]|nr:hypothetical protein [Candidatus Diapherotrites archaeon]